MFYDVFHQLCQEKGVSPNKACIEMGLSRSVAAKWKNTKTNPSADVLPKIADYFGVTVDSLLSDMAQKNSPSQHDDENVTLLSQKLKEVGIDIQNLTPPEVERLVALIKIGLNK